MASEWPVVRLGDYCTKIGSGATPRGGKETYLEAGEFALIRSQNVYNDGFHRDGLAFISPEQAKALDGVAIEAGDVLVNITGDSVARICQAPDSVLPARVNQHVAIVRPDPRQFDPKFVRYFLVAPRQQELLLSLASIGATRSALTKGMLEALEIPRPDIDVQREVVQPLWLLEQRIESLRQTNATLEAIAQALFKSWFVDFDPVRAKAEGREPEGMGAATAALFPSEFESSEAGRIPKGWSTRSVYDLGEFVNGAAYKAFQPNLEQRGLPIIKIAELKAGITRQTAYSDVDMPQKYYIDSGDILFSWSGNPDTSIDTFVWSLGPALLNQHVFKVVPKVVSERSFVLVTLKYLRPEFAEIARNKQTTGLGHVTVGDLKEMRVSSPPAKVVESWSRLVDPILARVLCNQHQLQSLSDLRDTLLPRLISGKLRLPEAALEVAAVA